jgi:phage terminase large subunit GpA-like protein
MAKVTTATLERRPTGPSKAYYGAEEEHPYGLDLFERLMQNARRHLKVARPLRGSTWVQENLSLDNKTSPDAVNRVKLFGYQLEPVDAMCDTTIPRVVFPKSARVGASLMMTVAPAYLVAHEAAPVCYASMTVPKTKEWLKTNYNPMFEHTDNLVLRRIVREHKKGKDQDELLDRYYGNGGMFRGRGGATDDAFRGYRAKRMFLDEVDAKPWQGQKDSQGDRIELALDRTAEYFDGGMVLASTPNHLHSSLIWPNWLRTDMRHYFVPCPHCTGAVLLHPAQRDGVNFEMDVERPDVSGFQRLEFGDATTGYGIKFDTTPGVVLEKATYGCRHCGSDIEEYEQGTGYSWKAWMDRHGEWRPTNGTWIRGDRPGHWIAVESDAEPGWRGYHVWAAYSCTPGVTWLKIARTFLRAVRRGGNALQNFHNTWLGLPWEARMAFSVHSASKLKGMTVNFPGECPEDVIFATLTVDVQAGTEDGTKPPRLECQFVGHGRRDTTIVLDYVVLDKHMPFTPQADDILDALRKRVFLTPSGRRVIVMATGIDRGFDPNAVMNYCMPRWRERVFAIRGEASETGRPKDNLVPRIADKDAKNRQYFTICSTLGKTELMKKMGKGPIMSGLVIPRSLAYFPGYLEGLTAEKPHALENGNVVFVHNRSIPNESFDTLYYSLAMRDIVKNMVKGFADNDLDKLADGMGVPHTLTVFSEIEEDRSVLAPAVGELARSQEIVSMPTVENHAHVVAREEPQGRFRPARHSVKVKPAGAPMPADPQDHNRPRGLGPRVRVKVNPSNGGFRRGR